MRLLPLALAVALGATAMPALGASWTAPSPLQAGSRGPFAFFQADDDVRNEVQADIDAAGDALVVWSTPSYLSRTGGASPMQIRAAVRRARQGWGPLEYLGGAGRAPGGGLPDLDVNDAGDGVAVWDDGWAYRLSGDANWTNALALPADLACDGPPCVSRRRVAIEGSGAAVMVWRNGSESIAAAEVKRAASEWEGPVILNESGNPNPSWDPDVAMDAGRQVVAVWREVTPAGGFLVKVRRRLANSGGFWEAVGTLGPAWASSSPRVATGEGGDAGVVWEQVAGGNIDVYASVRRVSGTWQTLRVGRGKSGTDGTPSARPAPAIGIDGAGNAVVAWQSSDAAGRRLVWSTLPAGGAAWSAPQTLAGPVPGGGVFGPSVSIASSGAGIISSALGTHRRTAGGGWTQQPAAGVVERSSAVNDAGFAVRAAETDGPPVNEVDQPRSGRWLMVTGSVLDPDLPDRDADGVADATDGCPDSPGPVANGGCPSATIVSVSACPPDCTVSGLAVRPAVRARWSRTGLRAGVIGISGAVAAPTPLTVEIVPPRSAWRSPVIRRQVTLAPGRGAEVTFSGRYAPGLYTVRISNRAKRLLLTAPAVATGPRDGLLAEAYVSWDKAGGYRATRLKRGRAQIFATFRFASAAAVPRLRGAWRVVWTTPRGTRPEAGKPRGQVVRASLGVRGGPALSRGRWTARLVVGSRTVGTTRVVID
jgi:hypothetical protein